MRETAGSAVELDRDGKARCKTRDQAKKQSQAEAVSNAENDGVCNYASKQAERAVLSAEQVIGEVEAAYYVETGAGDADSGDDVVIDGQGERLTWESRDRRHRASSPTSPGSEEPAPCES